MIKRFLLVGTLLGLGLVVTAEPQMNSKLYVTGSLGYANTGWDYADYASTGIGFAGFAGYRYNRTWAFEAGFTHLPEAKLGSSKIKTNALSAFARLRLPIELSRVEFYTKLGFGYLMTSGQVSNNHLGLGFGYGVEYALKNNLSLQGQYTHYVGNYKSGGVPNADYYSVGVTYRLPTKLIN